MIDDEDSVQLSEYCFNVCEVLKTAVHGKDADNLDKSVRAALEDLERCVDLAFLSAPSLSNSRVTHEIERTLRRGVNMQRNRHNKSKVEGHKLKIQEILDALNAPSAAFDENLPVDSHDDVTSSTSESGAPLASPL